MELSKKEGSSPLEIPYTMSPFSILLIFPDIPFDCMQLENRSRNLNFRVSILTKVFRRPDPTIIRIPSPNQSKVSSFLNLRRDTAFH